MTYLPKCHTLLLIALEGNSMMLWLLDFLRMDRLRWLLPSVGVHIHQLIHQHHCDYILIM
jgi:hypothetical protein